jgi:hypothetical protein
MTQDEDFKTFNRDELIAAFDCIGEAAVKNGVVIDLAIYGGSALMLASRFRFATEDVDVAEMIGPRPEWFDDVVGSLASKNGWSSDWLNEAVQFHLSPLADFSNDHVEFSTFPPHQVGLRVFVPTAEYMLALRLKAIARINDPVRGLQETIDLKRLLATNGVSDADEAISILRKFYPKSAKDEEKYRFFLKHIWQNAQDHQDGETHYPIPGR